MVQIDRRVTNRAGTDRGRGRLGRALRKRRRLRTGIIQLVSVAVAIGLGVAVPRIGVGAEVPTTRTTEMLVAVGAGFVPFIGIVFSLLFLVVQFGSTTFTPRLSLFRDAPIVWHAFAFFTAVIAFSFTAAFSIGSAPETTALVPIILGIAVLGAITLLRLLQNAAFQSIQLASILQQLVQRGRHVIDGVYPAAVSATTLTRPVSKETAGAQLASGDDVLWPGRAVVLQTIDVPRLVRLADHEDAVIEVCAAPGETIAEQSRIAILHGAHGPVDHELLQALSVGPERTFEQDPALALRVLAYISLRALSPAINDPTTAVQTLDAIDGLLRVLVRRDLGVEQIDNGDGTPRLILKLATWEDYLGVAVDEIISVGLDAILVRRRINRLLEELLALAPPQHREPIETRLQTVTAHPTLTPTVAQLTLASNPGGDSERPGVSHPPSRRRPAALFAGPPPGDDGLATVLAASALASSNRPTKHRRSVVRARSDPASRSPASSREISFHLCNCAKKSVPVGGYDGQDETHAGEQTDTAAPTKMR
jgi:uncharacterized membrane protein